MEKTMSNKFKGKNSLRSTISLAGNRSNYKQSAFPKIGDSSSKPIVDFNFAERTMYGRTDQNLNVIVPRQESLKTIISQASRTTITLMNFVADAFSEFEKTFERARNIGKIRQNDPYLSFPQSYNAYQNPKDLYEKYFSLVMQTFENTYRDHTKITGPKDYFDQFLRYIDKITPTFPITYTAWQRSRYSSIFTSGLAIDLAGLAIDNDELKENFINSENFDFYKNSCIKHGFSIVKNSPWVIVADLDSPASSLYHRNYALSSISEIFSENFSLTSEMDIEYLKQNLYTSYNNFVNRYPYRKVFETCNNKLITNNEYRYTININKFNNIFNNIYIIEYYNNIRFFEENIVFSVADRNKFSKNAKNLQKTFDISRGIGYINEQYRSVYKSKPGGLNYVLKKLRAKQTEE
jgi:hypothetical protein